MPFGLLYVILVIETDSDELLGMSDRGPDNGFGRLEEVALYAARGTFQMVNLVLQELESVFDRQDLFNRKYNPRKFQEIVAYRFREIKADIPEYAAQTRDVWRAFPGKVHEFQGYLL